MPESPNPGQSHEALMTTLRERAESQQTIAAGWAICFRGLDGDSEQEQFIAWRNAADAFAAIIAILDASENAGDWPGGMPKPPPYPADDENTDA